MRLLVVDDSLLFHIVQRLAPAGVDVEKAVSFEQARLGLSRNPPGAAIFSVTPAPLPWELLEQLCRQHEPPIPFLYHSSVYASAAEAGVSAESTNLFFRTPLPLPELRQRIDGLVGAASTGGVRTQKEPTLGEDLA